MRFASPEREQRFEYIKAMNENVQEYAHRWVTLMETRMDKGERLFDIARETAYQACTSSIDTTVYQNAVELLNAHWEHGEELGLWSDMYHKMYGTTPISQHPKMNLPPTIDLIPLFLTD